MTAIDDFLFHFEQSENFLCYSCEEMADHEDRAERLFERFTDIERESVLDQLGSLEINLD